MNVSARLSDSPSPRLPLSPSLPVSPRLSPSLPVSLSLCSRRRGRVRCPTLIYPLAIATGWGLRYGHRPRLCEGNDRRRRQTCTSLPVSLSVSRSFSLCLAVSLSVSFSLSFSVSLSVCFSATTGPPVRVVRVDYIFKCQSVISGWTRYAMNSVMFEDP